MFEYRLREEVETAKKAAMGEIYNLARNSAAPGEKVYNFASGHPDPKVFPGELLAKYMNEGLQKEPEKLLQYGSHLGYEPLRKSVKEFLNRQGNIVKDTDDVMITYGATEAIFLTLSVFIEKGDQVAVDMPSFVNAINAIKILGGKVKGIPLESDGVNVEYLEKVFQSGTKVYYTIPNFSNPSGVTVSLEKRRIIYELAVKYNVLVIEDDTYGLVRYEGTYIPSIKSFDKEGAVVYIGTFSKTITPGMRVGYLAGDKYIVKKITPLKATSSNGVINITQYAVNKMLEEGQQEVVFQKICNRYAEKYKRMLETVREAFPSDVKYSTPGGGLYLWVTMPDQCDAQEFCRWIAAEHKVAITPGNGFFPSGDEKCSSMRMNIVKEEIPDIQEGIALIGKMMRQYRNG